MKNFYKVIITLLITLCLSGCQIAQYAVQGLLSTVKDDTKGKCYDKSVEIIRCFDEKDVEGLKSLFCQYSQDNDSIYSEIEEAFNVYEGKSVSFQFNYNGGVAGKWIDGKAVDKHVTPEMENITTDSGNVYRILYSEYLTYRMDEKRVGITFMLLYDEENDGMVQIGESII